MFVDVKTAMHALRDHSVKVIHVEMVNPVSGATTTTPKGFIPGAVTIDLDKEGSDHSFAAPHRRLTTTAFAKLLGKLGITSKDTVYVYDNFGIFCAPRLWFMLKMLGHQNAFVIDGGLPAYIGEGHTVEDTNANDQCEPTVYESAPSPELTLFVDADEVVTAINNQQQILDARAAGRFLGRVKEPRAGVRSGHMPGAINLPYTNLLENGRLADSSVLKQVFDEAGVDLSQTIITSCGSGITACVIGMAALQLGAQNVKIYDGSWTEWGSNLEYPVEVESA